MRFKKPCVLLIFAGVHIHPSEVAVVVEPRLTPMANRSNQSQNLAHCRLSPLIE
jgi:hypothetical protein